MTDVLDTSTGQIVDHPDDQIAQDWQSGKVQPIAGRTYHFLFSNGEYGHASDAQGIAAAVQGGGRFVSADQAAAADHARDLESAGGGALGAGLGGAAAQLTAGLSDVAGRALGGDRYAEIREHQEEAHPVATAVGEGLGAAGLTALTGLGDLGEAVAERAGGGLLGAAARGALEGGQYGVSKAVSEQGRAGSADLGAAASEVGQDALFGAGGALAESAVVKMLGKSLPSRALGQAAEGTVAGARDTDEDQAPGSTASQSAVGALSGAVLGALGGRLSAHAERALEEGGESAVARATALLGENLPRATEPILVATSDSAQGSLARAAAGDALERAAGEQAAVSGTLSDEAVPDKPLAAAQLLASVRPGTLYGASLAPEESLAGFGASAQNAADQALESDRLTSALSRRASGDAEGYEQIASKMLGGAPPAPGLGEKLKGYFGQLVAATSGKDPDAIESFLTGPAAAANRAAILDADQVRDAASRAIRANVDTVLDASRDIQEEAQRPLKRGYIRAAIGDDVDPDAANQRAMGMLDETYDTIQGMLSAPDDFGGAAPLRNAMKVVQRSEKSITDAALARDTPELFGQLDDLKKAIGKYTKGASRLSPAAATDELVSLQNKARAAKLQGLYESLRRGLEDESVWGKAAQDQKAINAAWTTQIEASDRFHRALTTEIGRDPDNPWTTVRGVDPAKADAYVRGLLNPAHDLTHKAVTDYVSSTRALADVMDRAYELPAAKRAQVARLRSSADAFHQILDDATKRLTLVNQFEALRAGATGHASAFAATAGALAGGVPGGLAGLAVGKVASLLTRPAETVMQLAQLERMARESDSRIARGIRGLVGKSSARAPASTPLASFERKSSQIRTLAAAPELLQSRVSRGTSGLRQVAPRLADAAVGATVSGVRFLASKLPPQATPDPLDVDRKQPISASQKATWLRYYDAVQDPLRVLDLLRAGRPDLQGAEVLKTVYPPLFARAQASALAAIAAGKASDVTRQQRLLFGLVLDLPLPELAPDRIRARQALYGPLPPPPAPGGAGPKRGAKINLTEHVALGTQVDRVESQGTEGAA